MILLFAVCSVFLLIEEMVPSIRWALLPRLSCLCAWKGIEKNEMVVGVKSCKVICLRFAYLGLEILAKSAEWFSSIISCRNCLCFDYFSR